MIRAWVWKSGALGSGTALLLTCNVIVLASVSFLMKGTGIFTYLSCAMDAECS